MQDGFVAMITVECVDEYDHLDVSEVVALAREEHSIHLDLYQCSRRVLGAL